MRALLVSDLHCRREWFEWVVDVAKLYDVVVMSGDLLDYSSALSIEHQLGLAAKFVRDVSKYTPVCLCSGNHDVVDGRLGWIEDLGRSHRICVDNQSYLSNDVRFCCFPWREQAFETSTMKQACLTEIWVHHAPPSGTQIAWDGHQDRGGDELTQAIRYKSPAMVLTGHVHDSPFVTGGSWNARIGPTWLLTAGHSLTAIPAYVAIDFSEKVAQWFVNGVARGELELSTSTT